MRNGGDTTDFSERSRRWSAQRLHRPSEGSGRFSAVYESYADQNDHNFRYRYDEDWNDSHLRRETNSKKKSRLTFRKIVLALIVLLLPPAAIFYPDCSHWLTRGRAYFSSLFAGDEFTIDYQDALQQGETVPVQEAVLTGTIPQTEATVPVTPISAVEDPFLPILPTEPFTEIPEEDLVISEPSSSEEQIPQAAALELEELGAVSSRLQCWGDHFWRFSCRVPYQSNLAMTYEVEAVAPSLDEAIAMVCQKIRNSRQERQGVKNGSSNRFF